MIGLARLHAYNRQGIFQLIEVPRDEAPKKQKELSRTGWIVTHTELC